MEILNFSTLSDNGRLLTIPSKHEFSINSDDYKVFKQAMLNIKGVWISKQQFEFPFSVKRILERIKAGETVDLRKLQLFPTPFSLAESMFDVLIYQLGFDYKKMPNLRILEPSAGTGNLIRYLHKMGADTIDYCEVSNEYEEILQGECEGITMNKVGGDFLKLSAKDTYDLVFANPPFGSDNKHLKKMLEVCKPGGYVVTLLGENWGRNYKENDFETIYSDLGIDSFSYEHTPRCESKDKEDWIFENTPAGFVLLAVRKKAVIEKPTAVELQEKPKKKAKKMLAPTLFDM